MNSTPAASKARRTAKSLAGPCLICGRQPADAHHLRFAQHRPLGRKVSDEFTVPLCRGHHRELHRCGDEAAWWKKVGIDPTVCARTLWLASTPLRRRGPFVERTTDHQSSRLWGRSDVSRARTHSGHDQRSVLLASASLVLRVADAGPWARALRFSSPRRLGFLLARSRPATRPHRGASGA